MEPRMLLSSIFGTQDPVPAVKSIIDMAAKELARVTQNGGLEVGDAIAEAGLALILGDRTSPHDFEFLVRPLLELLGDHYNRW
jgi:hypothetical protein